MWDGSLGRVSVGRNRLKLVGEKTQPVYLALYRAGPKSKEFEKIMIGKR